MVTTCSCNKGDIGELEDEEELAKKRARIDGERERLLSVAKIGLFALIREGNVTYLQALLNKIPTENGERAELINSLDENEEFGLHVAVRAKKIPMIRWILSDEGGRAAGFTNIFATTEYDGTALHLAVGTRDLAVLRAIVEGCKVENGERAQLINSVDSKGRTVLHAAAEHGNVTVIEWILSDEGGRAAGFNKVTARDGEGNTALHLAQVRHREEIFHVFVAGCKAEELTELINTGGARGKSVLHWAAFSGHSFIISWLLFEEGEAAGFDRDQLFAVTNNKESVLHFAARGGFDGCLDAILSSCPTPADRKRLLLGVDDKGWNVFHYSVIRGHGMNIFYLVDNYPEESKLLINRRDNEGMTPLHRASIGCFDVTVRKEDIADTVSALLGYDWEETEACGVEQMVDGHLQTTRARRVAAAVAADPNLGLKIE